MASHSKRGPLVVEPSSLIRFPGPPLRPSRATVKLINNTTNRIAFKIKTTAPSFYGVRPNSGVVFPRNSIDIEIARQPFTNDQVTKINHKFMVQSIVVPEDVEEVTKLWQTVDPADLGIVKLRCIFEDETSQNAVQIPKETTLLPKSVTDQPIPEQQGSPYKIPIKKGDAKKSQQSYASAKKHSLESSGATIVDGKKPTDRLSSSSKKHSVDVSAPTIVADANNKKMSADTSVNTLAGAAPKTEDAKPERSQNGSFSKKSTPSMESLRRMLQSGTKTTAESAQKLSPQSGTKTTVESAQKLSPQSGTKSTAESVQKLSPPTDHSDAESKNLQQQDKKSSLISKQVSQIFTVGSALATKTAEPSEVDQSTQPSMIIAPYKYEMSYHSNDSTSIASKNPFTPKLSPVRLPSPEVSRNKMEMQLSEKSAQTSKQERKQHQQKRKSEDIFTQLQIATMNTEIHQLRTENKYLFNENSILKDEIKHRNNTQPTIRGEYTIPHSELPQLQRQIPLCYIIASMTFAILCLIIGKFVL